MVKIGEQTGTLFGEPDVPAVKTVEIYSTSRGVRACHGPHCRQWIEWAQLVDSGKRMPFNAPIRVVSERTHERLPGTIQLVELNAHWATCPDRERFKRKR